MGHRLVNLDSHTQQQEFSYVYRQTRSQKKIMVIQFLCPRAKISIWGSLTIIFNITEQEKEVQYGVRHVKTDVEEGDPYKLCLTLFYADILQIVMEIYSMHLNNQHIFLNQKLVLQVSEWS